MNIPSAAFADFPPLWAPIASNGLVVGVILAIVMEIVVRWERYETVATSSKAG
ncbi:hypothetical protein ACX1C1_02475 [Paenibacillus sp. strain BS8-2]